MTVPWHERVRLVERLTLNAWPARVVQNLDGWVLRWTDGVTGRANSVWPNGEGALPLPERLAEVERFYSRRGGVARFQLTPAAWPEDLDVFLEAAGYSPPYNHSLVEEAPLEEVLREAGSAGAEVRIMGSPADVWWETYCHCTGSEGPAAQVRRDIHARIAPEAGFVLVSLEGRPAAVGVGVVERGWVGVYSVATHPDERRRGAGTAVMTALARWAAERGAQHMYLQVAGANTAARTLYARLGFRTLYEYYYRQKPLGEQRSSGEAGER